MPWVPYGQSGGNQKATTGGWAPYGTKEKLDKKKAVIKDSLDKAEKYYQESEKQTGIANFLEGVVKTVARPFISAAEIPKNIYGSITGKKNTFGDVNIPGVGTTQSYQEEGRRITDQIIEGKKPLYSILKPMGSAVVDTAGLGIGSSVAKGVTKEAFKPLVKRLAKEGGAYGFAQGAIDSVDNGRSYGQKVKDIALSTVAGGVLAPVAGVGFSLIGKAVSKLAGKFGERVPVDEKLAQETINDVTVVAEKPPTPEEENALLDALSNGVTKEEIVDEVGRAKITEMQAESLGVGGKKPRLADVVDQLEADGKKLTLEETQRANVLLKEGKSIEEIQMSLRTPELPQKQSQEAPKAESGTNVPDNGDEAFLKSVEERFKASKTNKFREATKDEQGRFTGSKSEKKFKTGDVERDTLSQSIQNRMDALKEGEEFKTTQTNFDDNSAFLKLEEIQNKIPKAKVEDLPALKKESDDITKELLEKRAEAFRPLIARDEKVRVVGNIAKMSDTFPEFRTNLKRSGYDEMKLFKNKESAETFFNQYTERAKYRVANEDPLLQEAKKYKSAEEYGNAIKEKFVKEQGFVPTSMDAVNAWWKAKQIQPYIGTGGHVPENYYKKPLVSELPKSHPDLKRYNFTKDGKIIMYRGIDKKVKTRDIRFGDFVSADKNKASFYGKVERYELDPSKVRVLGDLEAVYFGEEAKLKAPKAWSISDLYNKAQGGKNRLMDDFERVTGQKITPEQEAKIIELNKKLFGDEDVKITAQLLTPEGQKAFGQYKNKVIKILDGQADATDTFYHEAVHKYLDLFTTMDEQKSIYLEARKLWKTDNLDDLEEKIAENFIRYAKTNEGVIGSLKVMFDKVIDRIRVALKNESSIEALYRDILEGKAKKGNEGYTLTSKEAAKREKEILSEMRKKESEIKNMKKRILDEEKFLAREMNSTFIFDEEEQFNYQSFKNLLKRFKTGKSREELLSGDTGSIKRVLGEKLKPSELDHILYSQEKSEDEMLDYFRGIYEKDKIKVTNDDLAARAEQRLKSDPDYVKLQDELSSIKERKLALDKVERASLEEANKELQVLSAKEFIEPEIVPKTEGKKSKSIMAERLNKVLPDDFKIDENLDAIVIKEESEKAAQTIFRDKQEAIRRAFDPSVAPPERSAILQELAMIAERDGDLSTVSDLFSQRTYMARGGAQALNMEKASVLLNPQEKYMRDIVNSRLGSVKVNGKDLTEIEVSAVRKTVRRETSEATKKAFKIQDAQALFNALIC